MNVLIHVYFTFLAVIVSFSECAKADDIDSGYRETVISPHFPDAPPGYARVGESSMVITSDGTAHIISPHREGLRYFRSTRVSTSYEDINLQRPHMTECFIGERPGGELVAAYGQSGGVKIARNDGTSWKTEVLPTTGYHGGELSGAVSESGEIALLVTEKVVNTEMRLSLYRNRGGASDTWSRVSVSSTIDGDGNFAQFHEMIYDSSGALHIVYQTGWSMSPDIGANYVEVSSSGSLTEETFAHSNNLLDFKLALDPQLEPHVLFHGNNSNLELASRSNGVWTSVPITVPPGNFVRQQGGAVGLFQDHSGAIIPAIARNGISHVRWAGTQFTYSAIDGNISSGGGVLAHVDPDGYPVYLWMRENYGELGSSEPVTMGILRNTRSIEPSFTIEKAGNNVTLLAKNLLLGASYELSRSVGLELWASDRIFVSNGSVWSLALPVAPAGKEFFKFGRLHPSIQNAEPFE